MSLLDDYNQCLKQTYFTNKSVFKEELEYIHSIFMYVESFFLMHGFDNQARINFMKSFLSRIDKIKICYLGYEFKDLDNFICNLRLSPDLIPYFIDLCFFPNDVIDRLRHKNVIDKNYYYFVIDTMITYDYIYYYYKEYDNKKVGNNLFSFLTIALDFLNYYGQKYNIFLPMIILYSLENGLDKDKFYDLVTFSFENYDEYCDFIDTNNSQSSYYDLLEMMINKMANKDDFSVRIIE